MSEVNQALVDAIATVVEADGRLKTMPNPVTHGYFNRRIFLETLLIIGGQGVSVERDLILTVSGMTVKEFDKIKNEYVSQGIIKEEKNFLGVMMYSLKYE